MLINILLIGVSVCFFNAMARCNDPVIQQTVDGQRLWQDLKILSDDKMQGREIGKNRLAQQFIAQRFDQIGLRPFSKDYRHVFTHEYLIGSVQGANIVGWLKGQRYPEQYVVVSAHYDHLGMRGSNVFNGTDDNASGVAGMLALANSAKISSLQHSIIFLATDGEEKGLFGAKAFINAPPVPLAAMRLNLNLDMIAYPDRHKRLYLAGAKAYPELSHIVTKSVAQASVCLKAGHEGISRGRYTHQRINWRQASDHRIFDQQGIPFLYFGVNEHRYYHTEDDDIEHIDPVFYQAAVETIFNTLRLWDSTEH